VDLTSVLHEVDRWPVEDQIRLVQEIWNRLVDQGYDAELSANLKAELDRRLADNDAAPEDVVPSEEIKAQALGHAGEDKRAWA
jgi:putative addiction module component (TIGR02574 family)